MARKRRASDPPSPASSASREPDQLGTLPPNTLVLSLFPHYPYFPSLVLSRTEARRQKALKRDVLLIEEGKKVGCAVRFFGVNTCAVIDATKIEPFLVNNEIYRLWIWRSSVSEQQHEGWPKFDPYVRNLWNKAFKEAEEFAQTELSSRPTPYVVSENTGKHEFRKNPKSSSQTHKTGFLNPGTIVWTHVVDSPIWPAFVCKLSVEEHVELSSEVDTEVSSEPLMFIGDPASTTPLYTSTDSCLGFSADRCWIEHMRARSLMHIEQLGYRSPNNKLWKQWERACEKAYSYITVKDDEE